MMLQANKKKIKIIKFKEEQVPLTGVVATGKVVSSIFLAIDELFWVEELAVCSSPHFINHSGLEIYKHSTRDMLTSTSFTEKGVECIIPSANSLITWHLTIRLDKEKRFSDNSTAENVTYNCIKKSRRLHTKLES